LARRRASDLIMRLQEEFARSVSNDTIQALKELSFSHVGRRPKACRQNTLSQNIARAWRKSAKRNSLSEKSRARRKAWGFRGLRCGRK